MDTVIEGVGGGRDCSDDYFVVVGSGLISEFGLRASMANSMRRRQTSLLLAIDTNKWNSSNKQQKRTGKAGGGYRPRR